MALLVLIFHGGTGAAVGLPRCSTRSACELKLMADKKQKTKYFEITVEVEYCQNVGRRPHSTGVYVYRHDNLEACFG